MIVEQLPLPPRQLPPPPAYRLPTLLTTFSHLPDRTVVHDDQSMAYYQPAPIGADLTYGFEERIEREDVDEHLDGLVAALQALGEEGKVRSGIITWRGMMTRIMTAPFSQDAWEMNVVGLDGAVYIELHDPPEERAQRANEQSRWALQSYMGYAFEAYSTVPEAEEILDAPEGFGGYVNTNVQWCNVVKSAIGDVPVVLGGEVDCVKAAPGSPNPGLEHCVELKTNKVIDSERADGAFHKKLLKHWAQSYLLGIPTVEVGFRTDQGILKRRFEFATASIPALVDASPTRNWNPSPCLHFLHATLAMLMRHVASHSSTPTAGLPQPTVFRLRFTPRRGVELVHVGDVSFGAGRWAFLPEDYVRWRLDK